MDVTKKGGCLIILILVIWSILEVIFFTTSLIFLLLLVTQASTYDIPKKEKRPRRWRSKNNGKETKATLQVNVQLLISLLVLNTN